MNELNDFIQEFKDRINEPPKPKNTKVKIINGNNIPAYEGRIELLDKGMEFEPVYKLFEL